MSSRPAPHPAAFLAWTLWILCLVFLGLSVGIGALTTGGVTVWNVADTLMTLVVPTVGVFIALRQPRNPIGWLFCGSIAVQQVGTLLIGYCVYILVTLHQSSTVSAALGAIGGGLRGLGWLPLATFLLLLFPTGHVPSPRWRPVIWVVVGTSCLLVLTQVFGQDMGDIDFRLAHVSNPLAVIGPDLANALSGLMLLFNVVGISLCVAALVVRFRRSQGIERQQLKWFAYAGVFSLFVYVVIFASAFLNLTAPSILFSIAVVGLPLGAGIAILRYRLYDIDIIINRTLVYGSLTALLAGLYFGSVVLLQTLSRAVTGQRGESALAIVVSTLLIAALFQPLRVRLQRTIDHRFYRQKYDAAKTLAQFAATLRGEVELADLEEHLVGVVEETMRPTHVSLWLRPAEQAATQS